MNTFHEELIVLAMSNHSHNRYPYPFTAIVGQERMQLAFVLNRIQPKIGGVLLYGEKGTGKSTAARAFSQLWDGQEMYTLPLSSRVEDLVDSIDLQRTCSEGKWVPDQSFWAKVEGNLLYVDEINLLNHAVADLLLSDSPSFRKPELMIASMNAEEGLLRPQLLDRFGLSVEVFASEVLEDRIELLRVTEEFEKDPVGFYQKHLEALGVLKRKIAEAEEFLPKVTCSDELRDYISLLSVEKGCHGHRADIILYHTVTAYCAWRKESRVSKESIDDVAPLVLEHRQGEKNEDQSGLPEENDSNERDEPETQEQEDKIESTSNDLAEGEGSTEEQVESAKTPYQIRMDLEKALKPLVNASSGRGKKAMNPGTQGKSIRTGYYRKGDSIDFLGTLKAAAPYQNLRKERSSSDVLFHLEKEDLRGRIKKRKTSDLILFLVDASGSMGAKKRMQTTKTAVLSLLLNAYQRRDKVGMLSFRKQSCYENLPPTQSIERAVQLLEEMPTGGRTPLAEALKKTFEVLKKHSMQNPDSNPTVLLLTDGRANYTESKEFNPQEASMKMANLLAETFPQCTFIVIDTEVQDYSRLGLAKNLAQNLRAKYIQTDELEADKLITLCR